MDAIVLPSLREAPLDDNMVLDILPQIRKAGAPYRLYIMENTERRGAPKERNRLYRLALQDEDVENVVSLSTDITDMPNKWLVTLRRILHVHPYIGSLAPLQLVKLNRPECPGWGQWTPGSGGSGWLQEGDPNLDFELFAST